jgi:inosine-uridine nucleoside N-ribohydrolase
LSSQIPVYRGAEEPLIVCSDRKAEEFEHFHGLDGFGDVKFSQTPSMKLIQSENAVSALNRIASRPDYKGNLEKWCCCFLLFIVKLVLEVYK